MRAVPHAKNDFLTKWTPIWDFVSFVRSLTSPEPMQLVTPTGSFKLERIPQTRKGDLRAWDAADELLLSHIDENDLTHNSTAILVINDAFGALSVALCNTAEIHNWSDSYISHLAMQANLQANQLSHKIRIIPSSDKLDQNYSFVFLKIPKTLALLEHQLSQLKPHINPDTIIIAAAMSRHIHTSTLKLFEKIIGTTTTSRAVKKARLIFATNNQTQQYQSPYPKIIEAPEFKLRLINHANVFAKDQLDIGTRFFIQQLKQCPPAESIIDLGCGNGALGIIIQRYQPQAQIHFVDESYMAIASAKENYYHENPNRNATFKLSNCLKQFAISTDKNAGQVDLILCNPPFHQSHSVGDQIAWQMFKQSHTHLKQGGQLWIIGNRHLAYHAKLKRLFGNCQTQASNKKFVVLVATKND